MDTEGKKPDGKTLTKSEGAVATTANTAIKCETTRETKVDKNETKPHETTYRDTKKWLPYADKEGKEDEMGGKLHQFRQ